MSYHLSAFFIYLLALFLFGSSYFAFQFLVNLNSLKTSYIALTTFSEEEKQQIMSEELSVIQKVIEDINKIHNSNRDKMLPVSNLDKEVRLKLSLRKNDLTPDKFLNKNNKNLSFSGANLVYAFVYDLKEKAEKQKESLQKVNRNLEIAANSANDFKAQEAMTPIGYPYPGSIDPGFGYRIHPIFRIPDWHTGVDISAPYGANLVATGDGVVTGVGWGGGYGLAVTIYHRDGISTKYAHNSKNLVTVGQQVKKGQIIAKAGATGTASCVHVHYEVIINGTPIDPEAFNWEIQKMTRVGK